MSSNKASGNDGIPIRLLKEAAPSVSKSLAAIINASIRIGIFPNDWKVGKISPIHKEGCKTDPNNYRPISILSAISKIIEKIVFKQFYDYLNSGEILNAFQSGFRPDHFLWLGDFGTLKQVIAELLGIDEDAAECGSDTAHNMLSYKADKVTVKWYKTTHRRVLQGPDHKLLSEKLLKLVEEREMADTVIVDLSDRGTEQHPSKSTGVEAGCITQLKFEMQTLRSDFTELKSELAKVIDANLSPTNSARHLRCPHEDGDCRTESMDLKRTIERQKITIERLEEEKASLITALNLVVRDSTIATPATSATTTPQEEAEDATWTRVEHCKKKLSETADVPRPRQQERPKPKHKTEKKRKENRTNQTTTVIVGDSMVSKVRGWEIGKQVGHRVVVKSFSGATSQDMKHYIQPTLNRKPDQIIIHVGTNDLADREPTEIADNIIDMAKEVEDKTGAGIIISELVTRSAENGINEKVKQTNHILRRFCKQAQRPTIGHDNIDSRGLYRDGPHLNSRGTNQFKSNFINFLTSND